MNGVDAIRTALERNAKAVSLRPAVGQGTAISRARLRDGLSCDVQEGNWKLVVGMPQSMGGANEGPTPGVFGRAAFGTCLAISYGMWAARLGVSLESVEIDVYADYDARGELDASSDVRPGYLEIRYVVRIESSAPESDVLRVLDTADKCSTFVDVFSNGVPLRREVQISTSAR